MFTLCLLMIQFLMCILVNATPIPNRLSTSENATLVGANGTTVRNLPPHPPFRPRSAIEHFKRDREEFIGWHGTNSITAGFWAQRLSLERPPIQQSFSEYLGFTSSASAKLTSGADEQSGVGLYVTDDRETAEIFARMNQRRNPGTEPSVCAIFARSSDDWRNGITKVFIPNELVGDAEDKTEKAKWEKNRVTYLKKEATGVPTKSIVRISRIDKYRKDFTNQNQLLLPNSVTSRFSALCAPPDHPITSTRVPHNRLNYLSTDLQTAWKVKGTEHM